jgi:hypothetical protein
VGGGPVMIRLFGLTAFVAAALLFSVEPMVAKALLPMLGGSASVWSTCLAFFQAALLLGYGYAHATSRLSSRHQAILHLAMIAACVASRPSIVVATSAHPPGAGGDPTWWLIATLSATVGLPFVAISATSSLLQRWYTTSQLPGVANPYPLYVASNVGSLLALLAYPFAIEPGFSVQTQAKDWWLGFLGFAGLMAICVAMTIRSAHPGEVESKTSRPASDRGRWWLWIALAFVPSSLMQGVTMYLSTDIAPIPLLWVVPLALYLLSFILTFTERPVVSHSLMIRLLPMAVLLLVPSFAGGLAQWFWIPVHLICFFVAAMVCHGELARRRPPPGELTGFYLAISLGGVLGSLFNAIIAPTLFDRPAEYPISIVLTCLVLAVCPRPDPRPERLRTSLLLSGVILVLTTLLASDFGAFSGTAIGVLGVMTACGLFVYVSWTHTRRPVALALSMGAIAAGIGTSPGVDGRVLRRDRNFHGILRVTQDDKARVRRLFHGWTLHGQQSIEPGKDRLPSSYYVRGGPGSQVIDAIGSRDDGDRANIAIVGLGIGSMATYARTGQSWTFYELDPAVERIARDASLFTHIRDCPASSLEVVLGDARLRLGDAPAHHFQVIVLDAFSSDAIPIHLLTREALSLYLACRAPGGLIAFHISNRYLDLEPVLGALAADRGMIARVRGDLTVTEEDREVGKMATIWVVLADTPADLGAIGSDPRWLTSRVGKACWTDERSSLFDCLSIVGMSRQGR